MNIIFVVTHKDCSIPMKRGFLPILVGKKDFAMKNALRDDEGDNIAFKNPNYCELTAQYYMWKNFHQEFEYIGLSHYRRYFSTYEKNNSDSYFVDSDIVDEIMKSCDIILPRPTYLNCTVFENYYKNGFGKKKDLERLLKIIIKRDISYKEAICNVLLRNWNSYCNMFIMSKELFYEYNQWLFDILGEMERKCDLTDYSVQEARIYGYLSEIMLNIWVERKGLKVTFMPVVRTDIEDQYKKYYYRGKIGQIKNRVQYLLKWKSKDLENDFAKTIET